jgi:hypothetical protein
MRFLVGGHVVSLVLTCHLNTSKGEARSFDCRSLLPLSRSQPSDTALSELTSSLSPHKPFAPSRETGSPNKPPFSAQALPLRFQISNLKSPLPP